MTSNSTGASSTSPRSAESTASKLQGAHVALRRDLVVTRQVVRGAPRYVVHDPATFRNHILSATEYQILCALVPDRTLGETFAATVRDGLLIDEHKEEFFGFITTLHGMGLLVVPGAPTETAWSRHVARKQQRRQGWLRSLLSLRIPLGSPDRHLQRLLPYVQWLFAAPGVMLWSGLALLAIWQCGGRLGELYGNAGDLLALSNLPILWCVLVGMKMLHELGHAFAIKRFGGAVPDFGVLFVMMTPCAYVDANASWTFASRWQRIVVGLGGMYVETLIAFVFALVWAGTSPGLLHDVAHNIVVLATVTTVLINSNPLVKFDGYFVFSDLLGIVNLQDRATRSLRGLAERWLLGLPQPELELGRGERWLIGLYAPASVAYRISVAVGISALMLTHWPGMGIALGIAFAWMLILDPVRRMFLYLWGGERTAPVRFRARCVASAMVMLVIFGTALLPVSYSVVAQGVLDPGVRRSLRAPSSAFVEVLTAADGLRVSAGQQLCILRDPMLEERRQAIAAELHVAQVQFDAVEATDPVLAATTAGRIEFLEKRQAELAARAASLEVSVDHGGTVVGGKTCVPGQYVHQGDELLQVHSEFHLVRVVLTDRDMVRTRLQVGTEVELRWTCTPSKKVCATVREIRRSASRYQVPVELTIAAGGQIEARPVGNEAEANQPYLHVFLQTESIPVPDAGGGLTASVLFPAREETLGAWLRDRALMFFHHWRMS